MRMLASPGGARSVARVLRSPAMELSEVMRTTGSARQLDGRPVDDAVVYRILDHARFAPSGGNQQAWHVTVVKDPTIRGAIRDLVRPVWNEYVGLHLAGHRPFAPDADLRWHGSPVDPAELRDIDHPSPFIDQLVDAPVVLVVSVRLTALALMDVELDREHIVGGGSIYPFCQNIMLAAREAELAGVMTTMLVRSEVELRPVLRLPDDQVLAALIVLGHPVKHVTRLSRRPVELFTTIDHHDGPGFGSGATDTAPTGS